MATIKKFEYLEIWQESRILVNKIYELTRQGEFDKDFGLKDQVRRSSVSVMNNISEGFESRTVKRFIDYLAGFFTKKFFPQQGEGEMDAQTYSGTLSR